MTLDPVACGVTLDVVFTNTGKRFLVNQHADEDIEDAVQRTFGEIPRGFRDLYAIVTVPVHASFAAQHPIHLLERPDIDAEVAALKLRHVEWIEDYYIVPEVSFFGSVAHMHLRWFDEIRSTNSSSVDIHLGTNHRSVTHHISVPQVHAMAEYMHSYYDEEQKRQALLRDAALLADECT